MIGRRQILSQLHGVPIAVKDLCFTEGIATAAGMPLHRDFVPAFDATVVRRLREAGAVLLGKLQLTEGAFADHHPSIPPPVNPWHADHWSGASSSGSGVATAAGLCFGSLGSDTGGSIRFPSAANGTTGLKPTWGRVSRYGCFELAASLDHIGPMCRSATDAAIMLGAIAGLDARRPDHAARRSARLPGRATTASCAACASASTKRYALRRRRARRAARGRRRRCASMRVARRRRSSPMTFPDVDAMLGRLGAALRDRDRGRPRSHVPVAARRVRPRPRRRCSMRGARCPAPTTSTSCCAGAIFAGRVQRALAPVDVMLIPAQPIAAPTVARMATLGQVPAELAALIRYTAPFDMSGHPTMTLPAAFTAKGLPVAVQFVGRAPRRARDLPRRPRVPARRPTGIGGTRRSEEPGPAGPGDRGDASGGRVLGAVDQQRQQALELARIALAEQRAERGIVLVDARLQLGCSSSSPASVA